MSFDFDESFVPSRRRQRRELPFWAWLGIVVLVFGGGLGGLVWFFARLDQQVANGGNDPPRPKSVAQNPAPPVQSASAPAGSDMSPAARPSRDANDKAEVRTAEKEPGQRKSAQGREEASLAASQVVAKLKFGVVHITALNSEGDEFGFGSGFVIDESGLVATNFHVIRNSSNARVAFQDGAKFDVKGCRAWDAEGDLAILELAGRPKEMHVLKLAEGTEREDAAAVIAIGHPKGFRFTTTTGIISAVHKTTDLPEPYRAQIQAPAENTWIQTNAAISGGSSGGPLLTTDGEVVGINTWIVPGASLGFAVDAQHLVALRGKLRDEAMPLADLTGPEEQITRIETDFDNQYVYFAEQWAKAKTDKARKELAETRHPAPDFAEKLCDLAEKHRETPSHFSSLVLACRIAASPEAPEKCNDVLKRAGNLLLAEYGKDPRLVQVAFALRNARNAGGRDLLRRISESDAQPQVRGVALYCLAMTYQAPSSADEEAEQVSGISDEGLAVLERVSSEYADVDFGGRSLGEYAKELLYSLKNFAIGRTALEIEGKDASGKPFKLSDFRGKVVVLDFWADWCPFCVEMYPHERKWVEEFADEPFALVGINCDEPARLKRVLKNQRITWANFADGPHGPIAEAWRVASYPTIYVLDHEGAIRARDLRGDDLEAMVKKLMASVPRAALAELPDWVAGAISDASDASGEAAAPADAELP